MKSILMFFILLFYISSLAAKPLDSLRLETYNGKKYIIHRVAEGETFQSIARKYGVDGMTIHEANPLVTVMRKGTLIKVPVKMAEKPPGLTAQADAEKINSQ